MDPDPTTGEAVTAVRERLGDPDPELLLVLGSGLSGVAGDMEVGGSVRAGDVPGLAPSRVPGHEGVIRHGHLGGLSVLVQHGRLHLYEGHTAAAVTRTVEVAAALGAGTMIITNSAGGLDPSLEAGDIMLITDQLNLTGASPLTGRLDGGSPPFVDMAGAYAPDLRSLAADVAGEQGVGLRRGVYAGLAGPAYETPAEVAMLRTLGATAVGMSTVLETIAARAVGMRVLGFSSITNVHREGVATSHDEVVEVSDRVADRLAALVPGVVERLGAG